MYRTLQVMLQIFKKGWSQWTLLKYELFKILLVQDFHMMETQILSHKFVSKL